MFGSWLTILASLSLPLTGTHDLISVERLPCAPDTGSATARGEINLLVMGSDSPDHNYTQFLPGVCLALNQAQVQGLTVMDEYNVTALYINTQGDPVLATQALFGVLQQIPVFAVIGPDISAVAVSTRTLALSLGVNMISYAAQYSATTENGPEQSNAIFRTTSSIVQQIPAYVAVFRKYHWQRVAVVVAAEKEPYFEGALLLKSQSNEVNVKIFQYDQNDPESAENISAELREQQYRIVLLWLYDLDAAHIVCQLHQEGMYGEEYFYFGEYFWSIASWPELEPNCTAEMYSTMLDWAASLLVSGASSQPNANTDVGLTGHALYTELTNNYSSYETWGGSLLETGLAFDATWAYLLSLEQTAGVMDIMGYSYNGLALTGFTENMKSTHFIGVSGGVEFATGSLNRVDATLAVVQYNSSECTWEPRGEVKQAGRVLALELQFESGAPPADAPPVEYVTGATSKLIFTVFLLSCVAGSVFCAVSVVVYFIYRNQAGIKLTSPKINIVTGIGCIFTFTSVISFAGVSLFNSGSEDSLDGRVSWFCFFYMLFTTGGFGLSYFALLAKVYRVYVIFNRAHDPHKKVPTDLRLILYILAATAVYVLLNLCQYMDQLPRYEVVYVDDIAGDFKSECFVQCKEANSPFVLISSVTLVLALMLGLLLGWMTRNVQVDLLNEKNKIMVVIYTIILLLSLQRLIQLLSGAPTLATYFVSTMAAVIVQGMMCVVVFAPGLYRLYLHGVNWRPEASTIDNFRPASTSHLPRLEDFKKVEQLLELYAKTAYLKKENADLRQRITEKEARERREFQEREAEKMRLEGEESHAL